MNHAKQYEKIDNASYGLIWRCIRYASVEASSTQGLRASDPEYLPRYPQQPGSVQPRLLGGCPCCSIHVRFPTKGSRSRSNPVT